MAKQARPSKRSKQHDQSTDQERIIAATLALAAGGGWRRLGLTDIAAAAGVGLDDVLIPYSTKYDIINAFQDGIDAQMLGAHADAGDRGGDARDRLFDLLMERFDALAPHKAALAEIAKDSFVDPGALCFLPRMARSMTRTLEAAGIPVAGMIGKLQIKALGVIYADAFRVWLGDESQDLAKTMAALDRGLRRAEKAMRFIARCPGPTRAGSGSSETDDVHT